MTEADLQRECNEYLRKRDVQFLHIEKGRGRNTTHRKGVPDLLVFPGDSRIYFIELKKPGGKLSPEQTEFFRDMLLRGYCCFKCDNFEEFVCIIERIRL
jgi:hypothetical protein